MRDSWLTGVIRSAGSCNLVTLSTNFSQYKNFVCFILQISIFQQFYKNLWIELLYRHLLIEGFYTLFQRSWHEKFAEWNKNLQKTWYYSQNDNFKCVAVFLKQTLDCFSHNFIQKINLTLAIFRDYSQIKKKCLILPESF